MENKNAYAATWTAVGAAIGAIYSSSKKRSRDKFIANVLIGAAIGWVAYRAVKMRMDNPGPTDPNAGQTTVPKPPTVEETGNTPGTPYLYGTERK